MIWKLVNKKVTKVTKINLLKNFEYFNIKNVAFRIKNYC